MLGDPEGLNLKEDIIHLQPLSNRRLWFYRQVHEKSVLLILLPVTLLAGHEPELAYWLPVVASFSMYPLLKKDGLCLAYAAVLLLWFNLWPTWPPEKSIIQYPEVRDPLLKRVIVLKSCNLCVRKMPDSLLQRHITKDIIPVSQGCMGFCQA